MMGFIKVTPLVEHTKVISSSETRREKSTTHIGEGVTFFTPHEDGLEAIQVSHIVSSKEVYLVRRWERQTVIFNHSLFELHPFNFTDILQTHRVLVTELHLSDGRILHIRETGDKYKALFGGVPLRFKKVEQGGYFNVNQI